MAKKNTKQKKRDYSDQQNQFDDPMAWGSSRQNYYKEGDDEYSSASQQLQEAQKIHEKHYQTLNDANFFKTSQQKIERIDIQEQQDQQTISKEYINEQLMWVLNLAEKIKYTDQKQEGLLKKMTNAYILILISIKQLDVPYIQHHPIVDQLSFLKESLLKLSKKINNQQNNFDQEQQANSHQNISQQEQQQQDNNEYSEEIVQQQRQKFNLKKNKGLQLYNKLKQAKNIQKKQRKKEKQKPKKQRKAAFQLVKQNQSRLASETILKNKGLVKKRKKIDGNSRLKLRYKYKKAMSKMRSKGIGLVRQNPGRLYQGQSNIKHTKIASTKLK